MSLVQDLWETTEISSDVLDRWAPRVVRRSKLGKGNLRTATVVWSLVGAVVLAVVAWITIARPSTIAAQADAVVMSDATTLAASLEPLAQLALSVGDRAQPDLVISTSTVLASEAAARALFTSAGELGDSDGVLARKELAAGAAGQLLGASSQISRLVAYRLSAERALFVPDLPTDPAADISAATEQIAQWRSDVEAIVADLPAGALPAQRAGLVAWGTGLQTWQEYYLDAMREGDGTTMAAGVTAKVDQVAILREELLSALSETGSQIAATLAEVSASLEVLVAG